MDPNAALRLIGEAVREKRWTDAFEASVELREWLDKGGFSPDWSTDRDGAAHFASKHQAAPTYDE